MTPLLLATIAEDLTRSLENIIDGVYVRDNFRAGTRVRVADLDIDATVLAAGPVSTRLRSESSGGVAGEEVVLPNHTMLGSAVKASPPALGDDPRSGTDA